MNIVPEHSLMLILLSNLSGEESPGEIYDRTRFAWKTKLDRARKVDFVISHNSNEEILGIYKPNTWLKADSEEFSSLMRGSHPDRVGFIGEVAPKEIYDLYFNCSTPSRKKGAANPIRYIEANVADGQAVPEDDSNLGAHSYLAGISCDDESQEAQVSAILNGLEAVYYKLNKAPTIYLLGTNDSESRFISNAKNLQPIKLYKGSFVVDDDEPSEEIIKKVLDENKSLTFLDEDSCCVWLMFSYPEEDEDEFEEPGEHWEYDFQQMANNLESSFTLVGYNSEIKDVILQQWHNGEFDEGAISNPDQVAHYSGNNVSSIHSIDLKCFKLLV